MTSRGTGKWGLVVFALGIILLMIVFVLSYRLFAGAANLLATADQLPAGDLPPLSQMLSAAGIRLGFLLLMGIISSLIASRGIALYLAAREKGNE